jgi:DNA mismatch endonuclease (patch repair protein)
MQGNRGRDTGPELAVRRLVHARGLRYRVNARVELNLRRTADMLFAGARVAVFVDGCYWHGCPVHYVASKTNRPYWDAKIESNRARDVETTALLEARGWQVMRFWAHVSPVEAAEEIVLAVQARRRIS